MKNITALTLGFAIGLSAISAPSFAASKRLKGDEITKAISGKTFASGSRSWKGKISYKSSTYTGRNDTRGKSFSGTWEVKGNKYCYKDNFGSGCSSVKQKDNGDITIGTSKFILQ